MRRTIAGARDRYDLRVMPLSLQFELSKGWIRVTFQVEPHGSLAVPAVQIDCGEGYRRVPALVVKDLGKGRYTVFVYIPPNSISISMHPTVANSRLRLRLLKVSRASRVAIGGRLALSYGLRSLREPWKLVPSARIIGAGWRNGGLAGLRRTITATIVGRAAVATPEEAVSSNDPYRRWIAENEVHLQLPHPAVESRFSVLIPTNVDDAESLAATLETLRNQPHANWECLIGISPDVDETGIGSELQVAGDVRISQIALPTAERGAMLDRLASVANGDFLLVLDPGDCLAPGALAALSAGQEFAIVHGDEDRIDVDGNRSTPFLKPDWSPELLLAFNYFGRPTALRRQLVGRAGGFGSKFGAGIEWDLHLRLTAAGAAVKRVPRILCHRHHTGSNDRPLPGSLAAAQHRAAITDHWNRQGIAASVSTQPDGTQRSMWQIEMPPLVSVIIPNCDRPARLATCLRGLVEHTGYARVQIIVVDCGSTDPDTLALYTRQQRMETVPCMAYFNYCAACNAGARAAQGDLLLFLNDDIEVKDPDWLTELVGHVTRSGVGVVGTMSIDPDGVTRQGGVSIHKDHCSFLFQGASETEWGPIGSPMLPRTLSAISGACLMARREVFAQVGGFDETYAVANGDVAFCLAARAAGWRVAYTPFAQLVQYGDGTQCKLNPSEDATATRIVIDIRRFGYDHDPFFHPMLDAGSNIPRLRVGRETGDNATLCQSLGEVRVAPSGPTLLDLANDTEVAAAVGMPIQRLLWPPSRPDAISDQWSSARWCLDLLRRRFDLRERFPDALSAGSGGAFAQWLLSEGARDLGLPALAAAHIVSALGAGIAARARQAVLTEAGLSGEMAVAFLPPGRAELFRFLLRRPTASLRLEEIWWLALECAEDPIRELVLSFRFNPDWQALFPDGLTVFGQERFLNWFRTVFRWKPFSAQPMPLPAAMTPAEQIRLGWHANPGWQRHHPDPFAGPRQVSTLLNWLAQPLSGLSNTARDWLAEQPIASIAEVLPACGVNVIGHFCYPSGLRTSVLSVCQALQVAGFDASLRDVPVDSEHDIPNHAAFGGFEQYDITLIHVQPEPFFAQAAARSGLYPRSRRTYRIGYWSLGA